MVGSFFPLNMTPTPRNGMIRTSGEGPTNVSQKSIVLRRTTNTGDQPFCLYISSLVKLAEQLRAVWKALKCEEHLVSRWIESIEQERYRTRWQIYNCTWNFKLRHISSTFVRPRTYVSWKEIFTWKKLCGRAGMLDGARIKVKASKLDN